VNAGAKTAGAKKKLDSAFARVKYAPCMFICSRPEAVLEKIADPLPPPWREAKNYKTDRMIRREG
jgi:hypothetical protein